MLGIVDKSGTRCSRARNLERPTRFRNDPVALKCDHEHVVSRLNGPLANGLWLFLMTALLGVGFFGMAFGLTHPDLLVHPQFFALLDSLGIPVWLVITVGLALPIFTAGVLGVVVWIGRRDDGAARLFSLGLLGLLLIGSRATFVLASMFPGLRIPMLAADVLSLVVAILLLFTFPTGTFRPEWTRWIAYLLIAYVLVIPWLGQKVGVIMSGAPLPTSEAAIVIVFGGLVALGTAFAQSTRFRRFASPLERQQVKWVAFSLGLLVFLAAALLGVFSSTGSPPGWAAWLVLVAAVVGALIPLAVGVALFRFHLYDIDRLISRTVSYTLVVGLLAAVFAVIAVVLPPILGLPEENPVLVAGATLAVAALFNPIRRRIQARVDGRFNRVHYNAEQEVDRFAEHLRAEMDIDDLRDELLEVVAKTLQPDSAAVWIREQA